MPDDLSAFFEGELVFNGINAVTGDYGQPPLTSEALARLIRGTPLPADYRAFVEHQKKLATLTDVEDRLQRVTDGQIALRLKAEQIRLSELRFKAQEQPSWPVIPGAGDPTDLANVGWAVIFPAELHPGVAEEIQAALQPLLELRQEQAGELYRLMDGADAYRPGERKDQYFSRIGVGPGLADPRELPFYILLIGTPEQIPYSFQYQLDVMRGVGRLDFGSDIEAYAAYAQAVVAAERGELARPRRMAFWAPKNRGDRATEMSTRLLVRPLLENLIGVAGERTAMDTGLPDLDVPLDVDWELLTPSGAPFSADISSDDVRYDTWSHLYDLLGGDPDQLPALLFTASHGVEFPVNHPAQIEEQGALLCQDWPGLGAGVLREHYFTAADVDGGADLAGLMAVFFACHSAGTPELDQFASQAFQVREKIAPFSFTAALPQRMLQRGALAVLGHVERAWGYSFISPGGRLENQAFVTAMRMLMNGDPIGMATDASFNMRYAEMSSDLSADLEELKWDPSYLDADELVYRWTANNDARSYVVLGDPAARLPLAAPEVGLEARPDLGTITGPEFVREDAPDVSMAESPQAQAFASQISAVEPPTIPRAPSATSQVWETDRISTAPAEAVGPQSAIGYGLEDQFEQLKTSLRSFTRQLATSLGNAAEDLVTLDVRTYSAADLAAVARALDNREEIQATLQALTRVEFDGDLQVYVSEREDQRVNEAFWAIHKAMVEEAQNSRANFLATMAELATRLLDSLRIGI